MKLNSKKENNKIFKTIMTIVATAIITFVITTVWLYSKDINSNTESAIGNAMKSSVLSAKLASIRNKIEDEYKGDVNENLLMEGAIKGYVAGLNDVYSEYLTKEQMAEFTQDAEGEYVGIGVYITKDTKNNQIVVYGTMLNSPAREAGLETGDIIVSVNGEECNGDDFDTITNKIKGEKGTKVKIKVLRDKEEKEFEIERRHIEIDHITHQIIENDIGYIYISSFEGKVSEEFEEAYDDLVKKGINSLIIDVRNNGGGMVDECLKIAELMTDKGQTLLIEEGKDGKEEITKSNKNKKINMPIVLLVNEYSASASEILAGILKDNVENATLIGNTTYGKGVIQTLYPLSDDSGLKITTDEYYTPKHNKINKVGIEPDIKIEDYLYNGTLDMEKDTQLKKAIDELKK